jgi:hypothetical protein
VKVVYAVKIHVFRVPSKTALPHSKVQVCSVDSVNADPVIFIDIVQNGSKFIDIPAIRVGHQTISEITEAKVLTTL